MHVIKDPNKIFEPLGTWAPGTSWGSLRFQTKFFFCLIFHIASTAQSKAWRSASLFECSDNFSGLRWGRGRGSAWFSSRWHTLSRLRIPCSAKEKERNMNEDWRIRNINNRYCWATASRCLYNLGLDWFIITLTWIRNVFSVVSQFLCSKCFCLANLLNLDSKIRFVYCRLCVCLKTFYDL